MSESPYIPFYTSDFLGGTSGMTAGTKGVYITLLCLMYETEGPLPQKWDTLARRCGCTLPAFKKAIKDLADDGKVTMLEAGIWSAKCEKHIARRSERRESAKAGAEKRWEKDKQKQGKTDANAMQTICYPNSDPDSEPEPEPSASAAADAATLRPRAREAEKIDRQDGDLTEREQLVKAMGFEARNGFGFTDDGAIIGGMSDMAVYKSWRDDLGLTWDEVIAIITEITVRRRGQPPPMKFKFFTGAMQDLAGLKTQGPLKPNAAPPQPSGKGTRNDRAAEHQRNDDAFRETIRRVRSGEV